MSWNSIYFIFKMAMFFIEGHERSLGAWMNVWVSSMAVTCVGALAYAFLASGNKQPWNEGKMSAKQQWLFEKKQFTQALSRGTDTVQI